MCTNVWCNKLKLYYYTCNSSKTKTIMEFWFKFTPTSWRRYETCIHYILTPSLRRHCKIYSLDIFWRRLSDCTVCPSPPKPLGLRQGTGYSKEGRFKQSMSHHQKSRDDKEFCVFPCYIQYVSEGGKGSLHFLWCHTSGLLSLCPHECLRASFTACVCVSRWVLACERERERSRSKGSKIKGWKRSKKQRQGKVEKE